MSSDSGYGSNVVTPRDVAREFTRCRKWLEAALEYAGGTHTVDDVVDGIADRIYQFWPGQRSAAITTVQDFPQLRVLNIFLAGGDLDEIVNGMEPCFVDYARQQRCDYVSLSGRAGWERVLKSKDWQKSFVTLTKRVPNQEQ